MKTVSKHIYHYLPLIGILLAGLFGIVYFSYDKAFQFVVMVALAMSYVTWGIVHHYIHDDLHLNIILEYLVVAFLGTVIVFSVLFRA